MNITVYKPVRSIASIKPKLWAQVLTIYALLMQLTVQVYTPWICLAHWLSGPQHSSIYCAFQELVKTFFFRNIIFTSHPIKLKLTLSFYVFYHELYHIFFQLTPVVKIVHFPLGHVYILKVRSESFWQSLWESVGKLFTSPVVGFKWNFALVVV